MPGDFLLSYRYKPIQCFSQRGKPFAIINQFSITQGIDLFMMQRIFIKANTLKFLDIVLKDIKAVPVDLCPIFLDILQEFVQYISFTLYEDVFPIFDRLLSLCSDILTEEIVEKCIAALVDRYSCKSKSSKNSLQMFTKTLIEV